VGDEVFMSIAVYVSRAMFSSYSRVSMEAKRRTLDEIAARQRTADIRRHEEGQRQQQTRLIHDQRQFSSRELRKQWRYTMWRFGAEIPIATCKNGGLSLC